jgi:hypothetical protein
MADTYKIGSIVVIDANTDIFARNLNASGNTTVTGSLSVAGAISGGGQSAGGSFSATTISAGSVNLNAVAVTGVANNAAGLSGTSTSGNGVIGTSTSGPGVRGASGSGVGVVGVSTTSAGVAGTGNTQPGVQGTSTSSSGVLGQSTSGPGLTGTSGSGSGVSGASSSSTGGFFTSTTGIGVQSTVSAGTQPAVVAASANNYGVSGNTQSASFGGVIGFAATPAIFGALGYQNQYALFGQGDISVTGNIVIGTTKTITVGATSITSAAVATTGTGTFGNTSINGSLTVGSTLGVTGVLSGPTANISGTAAALVLSARVPTGGAVNTLGTLDFRDSAGGLAAAISGTSNTLVLTLTNAVTVNITGRTNNALQVNGFTVWNSGNDGAGSGLDADLLDGNDSSFYTAITSRLGYTPLNKAGDTTTGDITMQRSGTPSTGYIFYGNSGARSFGWDGSQFQGAGPATFAGRLVATNSMMSHNNNNTGTVYLGNSGSQYITFDGGNTSIIGGRLYTGSGLVPQFGDIQEYVSSLRIVDAGLYRRAGYIVRGRNDGSIQNPYQDAVFDALPTGAYRRVKQLGPFASVNAFDGNGFPIYDNYFVDYYGYYIQWFRPNYGWVTIG